MCLLGAVVASGPLTQEIAQFFLSLNSLNSVKPFRWNSIDKQVKQDPRLVAQFEFLETMQAY